MAAKKRATKAKRKTAKKKKKATKVAKGAIKITARAVTPRHKRASRKRRTSIRWTNKSTATRKLRFQAWPFTGRKAVIRIAPGKTSKARRVDPAKPKASYTYSITPNTVAPPPGDPSIDFGD